ncbi:MAG: nucleotide sugar dehydrogenase [Kordiimonadaceae bacterium]|nr:nucleotide sugar dehydrogenase [Kordiimonadaceae bacterium]
MDGGRLKNHVRQQVWAPVFLGQFSVSVFGLGYVGAVSMACLSKLGHRMIGVDIDQKRVADMAAGNNSLTEPGLADLIAKGHSHGLVDATTNVKDAILLSDISLISVGTPTSENGACDDAAIRQVSSAIGAAIKEKNSYHLVVLRCSVPPGTTLGIVATEIERASGKNLGNEFGICFNPEFLRESTAVEDFFSPPKTVIGASDEKAGKMLALLYNQVDQNPIMTDIGTAEMVKYVNNTWHANKVVFANEIGRLCKAMHLDGHKVMDIFVQDTKLNLSSYYLKPGFAYGGSCLPKEVRAMKHLANTRGVSIPLITALGHSNTEQILNALDIIEHTGKREIGFLGITFKPETGDIRESPFLKLFILLDEAGYKVRFYDQEFPTGNDLKQQIRYLKNTDPRFAKLADKLLQSQCNHISELCDNSSLLVVSHRTSAYEDIVNWRRREVMVVDLVGLGGINETHHSILELAR